MKNKKLTALILCITMLFSITSGIFSAAFASDSTIDSAYSLDTTTGSAYKEDKGPMLFSTKAKAVEVAEEEVTPAPDYSYVIGETAAFNMDYDSVVYFNTLPSAEFDYENGTDFSSAYYDIFDPPLVEITNWYYDTTGSALWYQVKPLADETLPDGLTTDSWVLQQYIGRDDSVEAVIITDTSIIGKTVAFDEDIIPSLYDGIDGNGYGTMYPVPSAMLVKDLYTNGVDTWYYVDAVEGETWSADYDKYHYVKANMVEVVEQEEEDKPTNPCAICGEINCKIAHLYCEICGKFDCGQTHTYENPYKPLTSPAIPINPTLTEGAAVSIVDAEGNAITETGLQLFEGEKISLSAWSDLEDTGNVSYQWQICYDTVWVDIQGQSGKGMLISPAMVQSVIDLTDIAIIRCEITSGETVQYSAEIPVTVRNDAQMMARFNLARNMENVEGYAENPEQIQYSIIINYIFENGVTVANPYIAALAANSDFNEKITFPIIQGYLPYLDNVQKNSLDLNITSIDQGYTYTVVYKPTEVDYTIIHYQQNADNDNYTMVLQETKQAKTGTVLKTINDTAMTADEKIENVYEGFYALLFDDSAKIAADGSTVVKVYYDRYYYLINFVLDSGGYGTEPIYARYGATIGNVTTPTRAGYTFDGWTPSIPAIMPLNGATYTANWTAIKGEGGYTVVYWLQDPDPIKDTDGNIVTDEKGDPTYGYQFWGATAKKAADPGTVINGTAYKDYTEIASQLGTYEKRYSTYSHADTNVTVKGDGSTTVNVYYNRNDYTLKFYYAMSSGSGDNAKYYVVGGSTYHFGTDANTDARNDEVKLIDQYMGTKSEALNQRGQVKTMPTLNDRGKARDYVTDFDTSTVNNITYQYHYISFTAKYGADISELWPCAVFDSVERSIANTHDKWSGTTAFVSAWNGEHHVLYTQDNTINNGNQTVKGNYTELDYKLLWDYNQFGDNGTVAYLCFWENGADVSWSVPKLFRYNIYVEKFNGQDLTGETTKKYNGKTYYRIDTYDTVDDSEVAKQTATAIKGYTYVDRNSDEIILTEEEKKLYVEGYDVNFYYARISYNLTLNNYGAITTVEKQFGEDISSYAAMPAYPTGKIEADGYEFGGWYTTENFLEGTRYTFTTMPANNLMLYAYWVPKEYTVRFYEKEGATNPIATYTANFHGRTIPEACGDGYVAPNYTTTDSYKDGLTFIGWFYRDEQGIEKAFDLDSSLVMHAMDLYAKWSSNVLKSYTVYYKLQGTDTEIAAPETGTLLAGTTKTFDAKGGIELYADYQESYFPLATSHSLTIDIKDEANNTYTFWYKPVDKVPYSVYYVTENPKDGTTLPTITLHGKTYYVVKNTYTDNENKKAVVTADFEAVDGYIPDAYQKRLVLDADNSDNKIIFLYSVNTTQAYYKITHYIEGTNHNSENISEYTWTEYASSQILDTIGTTQTAEPMEITGFTYNAAAPNTLTSDTLTAEGLELKLYYTRNEYPYEVRYLEQYTGKTLAEATKGKAKYGRTFTGTAKVITNYKVVDESTKSIVVSVNQNVITFNYAEKEATINYVVVGPAGCGTVRPESETVKVVSATNAVGATATANTNTNYRFVGWYDNEACTGVALSTSADYRPPKPEDSIWVDKTYYAKFALAVADLTITKSGWESIDENQSFLFTVTGPNNFILDVVIHGNGSVTIKDLLVGTYTITEKTNWSWRYHPLGDTTKSITLTAGGSNIVEYGNSRSKLYWLDGSAWRDFHNGKSTGSPSTAVISIAFEDVILRDDELEQDNLEVQVA